MNHRNIVRTTRRSDAEAQVNLAQRRAWFADISITAASVIAGANAKTDSGVAGVTIVAGDWLYKDSSASFVLKLADADLSAAASNVVGRALNGGGVGQPIKYTYDDDDHTVGGTLSLGGAADDGLYVLSGTAGAMCPASDLAAGDYPVVLGVAKSTTKMVLKIVRAGVVLT